MNSFWRFVAVVAVITSAALMARGDDFDSAGVRIHYVVTGQGQPVILVHGLYSSAKMNWDMPGITALLARNYQVIALDNRGHGESDKPTEVGSYGVKMADDVVRLMDHLHIAKAHVVGYSMGGMIVMKVLTTHPERVRSAVLGGMGWLQTGTFLQRFWENMQGRDVGKTPAICLNEMGQLAVSEAEVKAVHVPVSIIVGDRDPCRRMYVEPLQRVRLDWPVYVIPDAGHLNCILKPNFKAQLKSVIDQQSVGKS
jgi:pimeloyl-ACP methyl ester carboxylesterase